MSRIGERTARITEASRKMGSNAINKRFGILKTNMTKNNESTLKRTNHKKNVPA